MKLSKYIWQLKDEYIGKCLCMQHPIKCNTRRCDQCLTKKYVIARADQDHLLNKRTEIISNLKS